MKNRYFSLAVIIILAVATILSGCSTSTKSETPNEKQTVETGTLKFNANGEDFVRQGFVSKDGWAISFDHVYVTLADIISYQADPPYDADKGGEVKAKNKISLPGTHTVDLAKGGENDPPILISEVKDAPVGYYNAISWNMVKGPEGQAKGYPLVIIGKAVKDNQTINFTIKSEQEYEYTGGEYIGDERKGIVEKGGTADQEMTFHFDHIFGDMKTPSDDGLNVSALGFAPFGAIAQNGILDTDLAALKTKISSADYQKLVDVLPTLGHVGEGHTHCKAR